MWYSNTAMMLTHFDKIIITFINSVRYLATCTDYFSKWPEAQALPKKSAEGVAHFLLHSLHGLDASVSAYLTKAVNL